MVKASLYFRPSSLEDALEAAASGTMRIAAGCTDLFPATERKSLKGPILDVTAIEALRGVRQTEAGLEIGAATTWSDILNADLPAAFDGLKLAAREVGAKQIQNRGTIGGNLCNASPAADGVPPLLTLEAEIELQSSDTKRRIPLSEFLIGVRQTALRSEEILTALHIPVSALAGESAFLKLGARSYLVISIAMVAMRIELEDEGLKDIALSVGACGPVATRVHAVEDTLKQRGLDPRWIDTDEVALALSPIGDIRANAAYRAKSAAELLRRMVGAFVSSR